MTTQNALNLTALAGMGAPVHAGAAAALTGPTPDAAHVHGATGLGHARLPVAGGQVASDDAVSFIMECASSVPDLWLVALGPLTNVALALQREPQLASRLAGLSIMGGSCDGIGNATAVAEYNVWADPEAAAVVMASGARIRLCGLNLTHQFRTDDAWAAAALVGDGPRMEFLRELFSYLHERMEQLIGERTAALHDVCALLALTHPELFEFADRSVAIELEGTLTRGMTVIDERPNSAAATTAEVAYKIDAERGLAVLSGALQGGASGVSSAL